METLSQQPFWGEDTCSVYVLQKGERTLLIDCGTDLRPLAEVGRSYELDPIVDMRPMCLVAMR